MAPLGKVDLLAWAEETGGIHPCSKYADLRDGVVFLALADRLFPGNIDPRALRRGPVNVDRNWDTLRRVMERHDLPVHLCDRSAISAGHARHCFNMLVLFYFLVKLSHDSDFCVDFANPIDTKIAEFLESPQSLRCVGKVPSGESANTETDKVYCLDDKARKKIQTTVITNAAMRKVRVKAEDDAGSMSSVSCIPEDGDTFTNEELTKSITEERGRNIAEERSRSIAEERGRSIAEERGRSIAEERGRSIAEERGRSITEERGRSITEERGRSITEERSRSIAEERGRSITEERGRSIAEERGRSIAEESFLYAQPTDRLREEDSHAADTSVSIDGDEKQQLRASHAMLLAELEHVRAASRLALAQQRTLVASEMSRMTEQFEARLAVLRLERDHEVRRRLTAARAQLDALAAAAPAGSAAAARLRAAESDLRDARGTAEGLRAALEAQRARHDAFAGRVEQLCAAEGHSEWDGLDSEALRGAAVLRVRALSAECRALRDENERLRATGCGLATPFDDVWDAEGESPLDGEGPCDSGVAECKCECDAGRRLAQVKALLCAHGAAARRALASHRAQQSALHARLRAAEGARAAEAQRAQRAAEAQRGDLARHAEDVAAAAAAKVRAAEERCARREASAAALHERASEMLSAVLAHARQSPALAEVRRPLEALCDAQRSRDGDGADERDAAMAAALREARGAAADAVAALASRDAALRGAEAARREAEERALRAEAETAALRDAMTAEARELRGLMREIKHASFYEPEEAPQPPQLLQAPVVPAPPDSQDSASDASCGRSLLSHDELERRKLEILGKYGFIAACQNRAGEL